jgi:hypothetical protein
MRYVVTDMAACPLAAMRYLVALADRRHTGTTVRILDAKTVVH